jgi:hypothetical protein
VTTVASVGVAVVKAVVTGDYSPTIDTGFDINLTPSGQKDSPFGQAYELFETTKTSSNGAASGSIALYCVGCGITGKVHLSGAASFSIYQATLKSGFVQMDGNVHAGLELGLEAQASYQNNIQKTIASAGLPGFSIPNVITVGPVVELKAELDIDISAEGQILVGATMDIPNFAAHLDLVDSSASFSKGFTPTFTPVFQVNGSITATAGLALPLSVGIGIVIPLIKLDKTASIVDKPGLSASASFTGGNDPAPTDSCYNGVDVDVLVYNNVYLDFFGLSTVDLASYTAPPLISTCVTYAESCLCLMEKQIANNK